MKKETFFDLFSLQARTCVNGVRKFSFNLKYLFHPNDDLLCKRVSLLSRVTLHDSADLWQRYIVCRVIFTQICTLPLIITRNMFEWNSCFRNYYIFPSGSKKQLQHKSTWNCTDFNQKWKVTLSHFFLVFILLMKEQKPISISIDFFSQRKFTQRTDRKNLIEGKLLRTSCLLIGA